MRKHKDGTFGDWLLLTPERGSNANGEYVRYADGTQECWGEFTYSAIACTTAYAGGFSSFSARLWRATSATVDFTGTYHAIGRWL